MVHGLEAHKIVRTHDHLGLGVKIVDANLAECGVACEKECAIERVNDVYCIAASDVVHGDGGETMTG